METKKVHGHNLADPAKRIIATLIDAILALLVTAILSLPFGASTFIAAFQAAQSGDSTALANLNTNQTVTTFITGIISLVVWAVVFLVVPIYVFKGQTLGKKLFNIKIANENGKEATANDILKRYSIYLGVYVIAIIPVINTISSCASFILPVVNLVMLFTDEKRQTLLDKVGQTVVVDA